MLSSATPDRRINHVKPIFVWAGIAGGRPRPELMAIHELELDALAQTREQRRSVSGKDRLHNEDVLVDQPRSANARGSVTPPMRMPSPGSCLSR